MTHYIFGIDFGTSTTLISYTKDNSTFEPELIEFNNNKIVETVLRTTIDGKQVELIGSEARDHEHAARERTFIEFKLKIGSGEVHSFSGGNIAIDDIGKMFLSYLREKIEQTVLNNDLLAEISKVNKVTTVIGYPAEWNEVQKKATVQMAVAAGFPNVIGCEEPLGAIYFHYHQGEIDLEKEQYILIYDFGGGTTDTSIVKTKPGTDPEVISIDGIINLGGKNYDERISEYQVEKIFREISTDSIPHDDIILIRQYSRNLKERLTRDILDKKNSSYVVIPWLKCKNSKHQMILTKDDFEKLHSDLIKNFRKPIDEVLSKSSLHYKDISMVISTGGSSRFYFVSEKLNEIFPDATILQSTNPQECIAKGLSLYIKKIRVIRKDHVKTIKQESVQNINAESDFYSDSYEQVKSTSNINHNIHESKINGLSHNSLRLSKWKLTLSSAVILFIVMIFASLIFKSEDNNKKESVQKLSSIPTTQNELVQKPSTQPAKQADKITDNKKKPVSIKITNYILKKMGVIIEDE